jgi:parallel beta-helix repeat protein
MKYLLYLLLLFFAISAFAYDIHEPIIVKKIQTTPDKPYIVEGFEIADPDGPGIQIREVDHVIIRNNYIHDCGTKISEEIQRQIKDTGKMALSAMNRPFDTGGILIFDAETVEIYNNKVINNDYGIYVWGYSKRPAKVFIHDNVVKNNHRASFIKVKNADNVDISKNDVEDNGLDIYIDNIGLMEAFKKGKDFPDGRSQGIAVDGCNHVRVSDNTVINSNSDGIGVFAGDLDYIQDIEIFGNTVLRNGEQGIWIVKAKNGKIHNNIIMENRHRKGEFGGSSGIVLEGEVYDFEIFGNNVGYNDVFGICLIASSNNRIYDNEIHHNGDGAFGWNDLFYWRDDYYKKDYIKGITLIRDNRIHHNRRAVFVVNTNILDNIVVEGNIIMNNGGNPIHYEYYDDYKTETHPKDWEYDKKSELLILKNNDQKGQFKIGENKIDVKNMKSMPESDQSYKYQDLPDISTFAYKKSDRFIVDMEDITGGNPFKGINSKQPHAGAHINFNNKDNRWSKGGAEPDRYPLIYAASDGVITRVDKSFGQRTGNDRYGVSIAFAKDDKGNPYQLCYSIEPMIPEPSEGFFSNFIKVVQGQKVHKGDIIAYMYIPPDIEDVHIHLHIQRMNQNGFMAPAIFTQEVVDQFHSKWKEWGNDNGTAMPSCMGYMLGADENPFGSGAVDRL